MGNQWRLNARINNKESTHEIYSGSVSDDLRPLFGMAAVAGVFFIYQSWYSGEFTMLWKGEERVRVHSARLVCVGVWRLSSMPLYNVGLHYIARAKVVRRWREGQDFLSFGKS